MQSTNSLQCDRVQIGMLKFNWTLTFNTSETATILLQKFQYHVLMIVASDSDTDVQWLKYTGCGVK